MLSKIFQCQLIYTMKFLYFFSSGKIRNFSLLEKLHIVDAYRIC